MKLFQYQGIDVKVDRLFLLMMVFYGFAKVLPQAVIIFLVVFIHELAHTIVARGYKVYIKEIELFPFGGVAKLDFLDVDSNEEIRIALAGPLANFFMAGLGLAAQYYYNTDYWLPFFIRLNIIMGLFNLIPVLPLDGGRIYRAWHARSVGVFAATKKAAYQGKLMAVLVLLVTASGLYLKLWDLNAVTMACFLFYSAGEQDKTASFHFIRYLLKKKEIISKEKIQQLKPYYVRENTPIGEVLPHLHPNTYNVFHVFNQSGEQIKTVSEEKLIEEYFKKGDQVLIKDI